MISKTYFFSGHVQGVGFRYQTKQIADELPVTGFVRNLSDGRVELQVCGDQEDIERLIARISSKMAHNISAIDQNESGEAAFTGFSIRY